jgi:hypothetical protein
LQAASDAQLQARMIAVERDDALAAVRRITAVAATHERRCSELQIATCEVCDMCARQQEELAAARQEAAAARNAAGSIGPSVTESQQQLAALRAQAVAAEALASELQVRCKLEDKMRPDVERSHRHCHSSVFLRYMQMQLAAQTQRCVRLHCFVQELHTHDDVTDNPVVMSVLGDLCDEHCQ